MRNYCWFSLALGLLFLILGLVGLFAGPSVLQAAILKTMALEPESDRYPHVLTQTALDDDNKMIIRYVLTACSYISDHRVHVF